jgi:hypothetical protein
MSVTNLKHAQLVNLTYVYTREVFVAVISKVSLNFPGFAQLAQ